MKIEKIYDHCIDGVIFILIMILLIICIILGTQSLGLFYDKDIQKKNLLEYADMLYRKGKITNTQFESVLEHCGAKRNFNGGFDLPDGRSLLFQIPPNEFYHFDEYKKWRPKKYKKVVKNPQEK